MPNIGNITGNTTDYWKNTGNTTEYMPYIPAIPQTIGNTGDIYASFVFRILAIRQYWLIPAIPLTFCFCPDFQSYTYIPLLGASVGMGLFY